MLLQEQSQNASQNKQAMSPRLPNSNQAAPYKAQPLPACGRRDTPVESRTQQQTRALFEVIDSNNDGVLDVQEFDTAVRTGRIELRAASAELNFGDMSYADMRQQAQQQLGERSGLPPVRASLSGSQSDAAAHSATQSIVRKPSSAGR